MAFNDQAVFLYGIELVMKSSTPAVLPSLTKTKILDPLRERA
jgi:hypothetical protein